jgi:hypothetical protein
MEFRRNTENGMGVRVNLHCLNSGSRLPHLG